MNHQSRLEENAWADDRRNFLRAARTATSEPAPRPTPGQGIDVNNPTVVAHQAIYESLIAAAGPETTLDQGVLTLDPYGTAPLSCTFAFYSNSADRVVVEVFDPADPEGSTLSHAYDIAGGTNHLIAVLGLFPDLENGITIRGEISGLRFDGTMQTAPLPATDAEGATNGFPVLEVNVAPVDPARLAPGLNFMCIVPRFNIAFDGKGRIRWYTVNTVPTFNPVRLSDGHFLGGDVPHNGLKELWKFDMTGRVHTIYTLYEAAHHSIFELPGGEIIIPSENLHQRMDVPPTDKDCVAIMRLSDGQETTWYDFLNILDFDRAARPADNTAPTENDWCHINQAYIDTRSNLIVASCRHQCVLAVERSQGDIAFILGSHRDWSAAFEPYLLQPVDASGAPLYDLTDPDQADLADREFWNWGQHHPLEVDSGDPEILEFWVFNNGNYRSREDTKSVFANGNYSSCVRFRIHMVNMTVQKVAEYGQDVGPRGYSSFVSTKFILPNGNLLVNFGGINEDNNGTFLTVNPGWSDLVDPVIGSSYQSRCLLQEVDLANNQEVLAEYGISSGLLKPMAQARGELFCFRAYKLSLYP